VVVVIELISASLVNAMANLAVPLVGQSSLPESYLTVLNPFFAANWQ